MTTQRPIPVPNADTQPYWDAADRQQLAYQRCDACGRAQFPPRGHCALCQVGPVRWHTSTGRGRIHAFSIVHRAPTPAFRERVPYAVALVDVEEGFRLLLNVQDMPLDTLAIGMPVRVVFEPLADGRWLPQAGPSIEGGT